MFNKLGTPGLFAAPDNDGGTGGQPDPTAQQPTEDWKTRFDGLRGRYQQVVEEHKTKETQFQTQLKALQDNLAGKSADFETISLDRDNLKKQLDAAVPELNALKNKAARQTMIAQEFPDLLLLEAQGLLPGGDAGDDLKQKLGLLSKTIKVQGGQLAAQQLAGTTPPAGTKPATRTADDIMREARLAYRDGKMEDYDRLMTEWAKAGA